MNYSAARRVASLFGEVALLAKLQEVYLGKIIHGVIQEVASLELDVDVSGIKLSKAFGFYSIL